MDFHEITWETPETTEDLFDYTFQVLRSEGAEGPYAPITPEMDDQYIFIDNNIHIAHKYRQYFYKIRVRNKVADEYEDFGPVSKEPEADLIALEIRKHMNLLFREFAGRRCWVVPVRTFGQKCSCVNPTLGKKSRSRCLTCYDTTFVGGYLTPIETWVQIDPNAKREQNTDVGPMQQSNTTARLGYWPPLKPRDLIIEPENKRWRVVQVSSPEQLRAALHQEIQIHQIPETNIEFKLELNMDTALKDMWLSPSRNFSNPHNLDSAGDVELPDYFGIYP